jgi:hypothetical protein
MVLAEFVFAVHIAEVSERVTGGRDPELKVAVFAEGESGGGNGDGFDVVFGEEGAAGEVGLEGEVVWIG